MDQSRRHWLRSFARGTALALGVALLLTYALYADARRMLFETLPSDAQSIQLNADHIATWKEAGQQVFLLRGNVVVSQGSTTIRSPDTVVWVDMKRFETDRVLHTVVYGDNTISLERGTKAEADFGYVRLATSGKVDIKPFKSKLVEQDQSNEPIYQRALAQRPADLKLGTRNEVGTTPPLPAPPKIDAFLRQASAFQPAPPAPPSAPPAPPPPSFPVPEAPKVAPVPVAPAPAPAPNFAPPPPAPIPPPPPRTAPQLNIRPRYQGDLQVRYEPSKTEAGVTAVIVSGGINLLVSMPGPAVAGKVNFLDIEADRLVVWTRGNAKQLFNNMSAPSGDDSGAHEVYMSGNVELRTRTDKSIETLRADEVYYDFRRNVAVARKADLELEVPKLPNAIHLVSQEIRQINAQVREADTAAISAPKIPSDPGLKVDLSNVTIEERQKERSYLWGLWPAYDKDGKRIVDKDTIFTGKNMFVTLEGVPVFYFPYLKGRVEDPLGPLDQVGLSYNRIFGFQLYTTWDVYDLLNLPRVEGTRARLFLDYLTLRGPGFGTEFDLEGKDYFGIKGNYLGLVKLYGIFDKKADILGGNRGNIIYWPDATTTWPVEHPNFRGSAYGKINIQEMDNGFSVLGQFAFLSDRNFLEQYYLNSKLNDLNQDTYLRVKQQQANWAWTLYGQISVRDWLTETDWLPKADAYLMGQTFSFGNFEDLLVYDMRASAGYARLKPTEQVPFAYLPTDVRADTARFDLWQDISMPFYLGPVKLAPYLVGDLTYYSNDVNDNSLGRAYGGAGVRGSLPFSRLYPDIRSELFNLNQIDHKISFTGNYFVAQSSSGVNNIPQLTRLNDDSTDQALRDIRPVQTLFNPANAAFLTSSGLFNPQTYAIRRLVDTNPDTLDSINVFQMGLRQRWQTQRGFAGNEHTIDWMTLNLQASLFPNSNRDNFGHTFGIVEWDWIWNIGDRTALTSSGWFEPFDGGPRTFDIGAVINRPDATNFYLGYRQIDPLNAKAVIASIVYPFSAKYSLSANTVWDFGNNVQTYGFFVSRMGTDVMVNFGINYNSTLNTFGVAFEMLPNLARRSGRSANMFPMIANNNLAPVLNQR